MLNAVAATRKEKKRKSDHIYGALGTSTRHISVGACRSDLSCHSWKTARARRIMLTCKCLAWRKAWLTLKSRLPRSQTGHNPTPPRSKLRFQALPRPYFVRSTCKYNTLMQCDWLDKPSEKPISKLEAFKSAGPRTRRYRHPAGVGSTYSVLRASYLHGCLHGVRNPAALLFVRRNNQST